MDVVMDAIDDESMWKIVLNVFPILKGVTGINEPGECNYSSLVKIHDHGLTETVKQLVQTQVERLIPTVADTFWSYFPEHSDQQAVSNGFMLFSDAVNSLHSNIAVYFKIMEALQSLIDLSGSETLNYNASSTADLLKMILRGTLHSRLGDFNLNIVREFYSVSFKVFLHVDVDDVVDCCGGCDNPIDSCACQEIMQTFEEVNRNLIELDLLERITGDILTNLVHHKIEKHVGQTCKGSFDLNYVKPLEEWVKNTVVGWFRNIYGGDTESSAKTIKVCQQKLLHCLYETYTKTRIEQLFIIIIEYPDSQPAIEDLRDCIGKTDLKNELASKLQKALVTRLLHSGVSTFDVLSAYISAIKALRQLDPTGVLLETATQPVRLYLRNREDTVKCIIKSLIDDGASELSEELVKGEKTPFCDGSFAEEDIDNWDEWLPDPIDADSTKPSKSRRTSDVISTLVNVYGSKDLFVKEYTTLLAERLLSATNYDTEKEYRYLELLKLRFGESELLTCEVMLKDIYDSKRINAHVEGVQPEFPVQAKILSAPFWPAFKEETLELPEHVKAQQETFTRAFEKQKGNRTLCWKPHLGSVTLEIDLSDRVIAVTTTPTRAALLWHFQTKNEWTVEELSAEIKVPPMKLRREVGFWQSQGILREVAPDRYQVVEESGGHGSKGRQSAAYEVGCDDEEAESVMASAQDQREEELSVFWSYIIGILTNLESMPLDRIHQMLKMFATQGPTSVECSLMELKAFLNRKVQEHKLMFSGGLYRLPKM